MFCGPLPQPAPIRIRVRVRVRVRARVRVRVRPLPQPALLGKRRIIALADAHHNQVQNQAPGCGEDTRHGQTRTPHHSTSSSPSAFPDHRKSYKEVLLCSFCDTFGSSRSTPYFMPGLSNFLHKVISLRSAFGDMLTPPKDPIPPALDTCSSRGSMNTYTMGHCVIY